MNQKTKNKITGFLKPSPPKIANGNLFGEIDRLSRDLAARDTELMRIHRQRNSEIRELNDIKNKLEESKNVLEIRVNAKNRALTEVTQGLEKEIKDRTRELREKVEEYQNSRMALMNMLEDMEDLRCRAEKEKEKTLAIITNFVDGLMFFNADDRLSLVNSKMLSYFGASQEDMARINGKRVAEFKSVADFGLLADLMENSLKPVSRKELPLGEKIVFEISCLPVSGKYGKVGFLLIAHDVSREKMVEKMKTEFVSIAAHQLRTPISAIKWTLRMILDGDLGEINEEQREFLEKTYKSNERMINLINDLLNVTRIEEGRHIYNIVIANLEEIAAGLVPGYVDIAKQKNITLDFTGPRGVVPPVKVDVEKIKLVVSNLIENAIKYTPANGKISVSIAREGDAVKLTVSDTGMGVLENQKDRIFTKYFRGANAIKMETEGTGLGLFISKNIVETHGGKIGFDSRENEGSRFFFTLPLAKNILPTKSD